MELFDLPAEVLELVCSHLSSRDLTMLGSCCKAFSCRSSQEGLTDGKASGALGLVERVAKTKVLQAAGCLSAAERWPASSWRERLAIEESAAKLSMGEVVVSSSRALLQFAADRSRVARVMVPLLGPELVSSAAGTAQAPFLRWHLRLENHSSFEIGAVPANRKNLRFGLHMPVMIQDGDLPEASPTSPATPTACPTAPPPKRNHARPLCSRENMESARPAVYRGVWETEEDALTLLKCMTLSDSPHARALPTPRTSTLRQQSTSPVAGPGPTAAAVGWRTYPIAQPSHSPWLEALAVPPSPTTTLEVLLRRHTSRVEVLVYRNDDCSTPNNNTHQPEHTQRPPTLPDSSPTTPGSPVRGTTKSAEVAAAATSTCAQSINALSGIVRSDPDDAIKLGKLTKPGKDDSGAIYLHRALPYLPGSDMHLAITLWRKGAAVFLPDAAQ